MPLKTIEDLKDLNSKRVILRVDFNTPLTEPDENGHREVADDTRIVEALPTIKYLLNEGAKLILVSHLGRPEGEIIDELRLDPIARALEKLLENPVKKLDAVTSDSTHKEVERMKPGEVLLLENVRFRSDEKECTPQFAKELASLADIYVNDAFGTAHRRHASTTGIAEHLPAYAGFLMEKEVESLSKVLDNPEHPLTMVFGGAKMDSKIGVIRNFIGKADHILVAGGIGNTFLTASGHNLGESLVQHDMVDLAREIMMECQEYKTKIILPHDLIAADDCTDDTETVNAGVEDFIGNMKAFDLGKWSAEKFCNMITDSKTVIWNGPVGVFEKEPFREGTHAIAECIAKHECTSILGGGDTISALKSFNIPVESFTHISTGGGASLEFLEGKTLPGIEALLQN
jgi:phosphoglycerate kinase